MVGLTNQAAKASRGSSDALIERDRPLVRGIMVGFSPRWVPEEAVPELLNARLDDPSMPVKRDGYREVWIGTTGIAAGLAAKRIGGIAYLNPSSGDKLLFIVIPDSGNGKCYYTTNPYSGAWAEALTGLDLVADVAGASFDPGGADIPIFQGNDRLWILGQEIAFTLANTGIAVESDNGATDAPSGVDGLYFLNRVWIFTRANKAVWSDLLPTTPSGTFSTSINAFTLSPNRGSVPRCVRAWRDRSLIFFFNDSIEELIVDPDDISASTRNVLEPEIGCCARQAAVVVGADLYFADQYGQIRSLRQTEEGALRGVVPAPLSYQIKGELPGRVNPLALDKIRLFLNEDRLEVYYPRDAATEADHRASYNFSTQSWESVDALAHSIGGIVRSDIRGRGSEVYTTKGATASPTPMVYVHKQGTYADAGTAISFRYTSRVFTLGLPEAAKVPALLELEYFGSEGAAPTVEVRADEKADWATLTAASNSDSSLAAVADDFPLVPADFPLVPGDFQLIGTTPKALARARYHLDAGRMARGRSMQFRVTEATAGKQFQLVGWRITASPEMQEGRR